MTLAAIGFANNVPNKPPEYNHVSCANTALTVAVLMLATFVMMLMMLRLVNLAIKEYLLPEQYRRYQCSVSNLLKKYQSDHSPTVRRCIETVLDDIHQFDEALSAGEKSIRPTVLAMTIAMGVAAVTMLSMDAKDASDVMNCVSIEQMGFMFGIYALVGVVSGIFFGGALDVVYAVAGVGFLAAAGFLLFMATKNPLVLTIALITSSVLVLVVILPLIMGWLHARTIPPSISSSSSSSSPSASPILHDGPSLSPAKLTFVLIVVVVFIGSLVIVFAKKGEVVKAEAS